MKNTIEMPYPKIFQTGVVPADANKLSLLADGLMAWGCCGVGNKPTEHFGTVLVEIGQRLGISATSEGLGAEADRWKAAGKPIDFYENPNYAIKSDGKSKYDRIIQAINDVVAAEIDHSRHGDPYSKLQGCIVALHKAAFE